MHHLPLCLDAQRLSWKYLPFNHQPILVFIWIEVRNTDLVSSILFRILLPPEKRSSCHIFHSVPKPCRHLNRWRKKLKCNDLPQPSHNKRLHDWIIYPQPSTTYHYLIYRYIRWMYLRWNLQFLLRTPPLKSNHTAHRFFITLQTMTQFKENYAPYLLHAQTISPCNNTPPTPSNYIMETWLDSTFNIWTPWRSRLSRPHKNWQKKICPCIYHKQEKSIIQQILSLVQVKDKQDSITDIRNPKLNN